MDKKKETRKHISIGSTSLVLVFIVLCLSSLGLLSVSSAQRDWILTQRYADAVTEYYAADSLGQDFLKAAQQKSQKDSLAATEIPMSHNRALHIELELTDSQSQDYRIKAWKVVHLTDWEMDDSMPVWSGE